ncbi:MAG: ABC transporter permease [Gemmatimonadaceae bacterium]|nr:ABC transporter permease [Gemmatimonadaceae bacterium]
MRLTHLFAALRGLVVKETRHVLRDRQTLAILLLMPLAQVLLYGFAIRTDVRGVQVAVVDPTPDATTRSLIQRIDGSARHTVVTVEPTDHAIAGAFAAGTIRQAIVLPTNVDRRLARREALSVQVITDGSDPNAGSAMASYAEAIVRQWHADALVARHGPAVLRSPGAVRIDLVTRMRFNPTMESAQLFVPGLIALVLTIVSAMMTAIAITREKELGTMELLLVSPLRPSTIVIGKMVPYAVLGMANVAIVLAAAQLVFHVPIRGSVPLLLAQSALYIVTTLALGLVISTGSRTQRAAMLAALGGLLLPTIMLSGFIFPIDSLPTPLKVVSHIIPARWFLVIVRGIMLKGAGLEVLWQETLILAGLTTLLLAVGIRRLNVRLDA